MKVKLFIHGIFWKVLWFLHIARLYSRMACRLNIYSKFMDGRCMWCGYHHKLHWKIEELGVGIVNIRKIVSFPTSP